MQDEYQIHAKHAAGNTKLIISRHPGEVASASCNTNWNSCANPGEGGLASEVLHKEIHHGTLMAMHVHKDSKPNEHGEYDSKDVLGRTLIKRHDSKEGHTIHAPEERSYGKFGENAKKATHAFTEKHYPMKDFIYKKHKDLYDDDNKETKINGNKIPEAQNHKDTNVRRAAVEHSHATHEHISKALNDKEAAVRIAAALHPNATHEHISKALNDENDDVRLAAINHPNATHEHISKALKDKDYWVRDAAARHPNARR